MSSGELEPTLVCRSSKHWFGFFHATNTCFARADAIRKWWLLGLCFPVKKSQHWLSSKLYVFVFVFLPKFTFQSSEYSKIKFPRRIEGSHGNSANFTAAVTLLNHSCNYGATVESLCCLFLGPWLEKIAELADGNVPCDLVFIFGVPPSHTKVSLINMKWVGDACHNGTTKKDLRSCAQN